MDATNLARWTRFAGKGGIGRCVAVHDCVAESAEDLMFLTVRLSFLSSFFSLSYMACAQGDEIVVLVQLTEEGRFLVSTRSQPIVRRAHSTHPRATAKASLATSTATPFAFTAVSRSPSSQSASPPRPPSLVPRPPRVRSPSLPVMRLRLPSRLSARCPRPSFPLHAMSHLPPQHAPRPLSLCPHLVPSSPACPRPASPPSRSLLTSPHSQNGP